MLFPNVEAEDRLLLKAAGLPTDPQELWKVVQKAYERREETIQIEEVFTDFVKMYGKIEFDPSKQGSDCFYISRKS